MSERQPLFGDIEHKLTLIGMRGRIKTLETQLSGAELHRDILMEENADLRREVIQLRDLIQRSHAIAPDRDFHSSGGMHNNPDCLVCEEARLIASWA